MGEKIWIQILLDCFPGPGRSMGCARDPCMSLHSCMCIPPLCLHPWGGQRQAPEPHVAGSILPKKVGPQTSCCLELQLQKQILHESSLEQTSWPLLTVPLLLLRTGIQGWRHRGHEHPSLQDQVLPGCICHGLWALSCIPEASSFLQTLGDATAGKPHAGAFLTGSIPTCGSLEPEASRAMAQGHMSL